MQRNLNRGFLQNIAWLSRLGQHELGILVWAFFAFAGSWAFVEIADEVYEGETRHIDRAILLALRRSSDLSDPLGPLWFEEMARDFTALGGTGVTVFITLAASMYFVLIGRLRTAGFTVAAISGGQLLSSVFKLGFDRARPDLVPHGVVVYTASFPSGHAMMAATVYLTLAALLIQTQPQRSVKAFVLLVALLITVLVGTSRVYLGVHWPSDVLAGWTAGAAWASICWLVARWLEHRGGVEASE